MTTAIKILAERRAGELLAGMDMAEGGRGKTGSTLQQLSIDRSQSHRWQTMAKVPEAVR